MPKGKETKPASASGSTSETYFDQRKEIGKESKRKVAEWVVENVFQGGDSILLDAGTSLYPIADEIVKRTNVKVKDSEKKPRTNYTIMTHNYEAFNRLVDGVDETAKINIVLAGGRYDRDLNALFGPQTIKAYEDFYPRVVLMGISGLLADVGLFCHGNTEELSVKEAIFKKSEISRERIIIADYRKLGTTDALCFGRSDRLRGRSNCRVVTDEPPAKEGQKIRDKFEDQCQRLTELYGVEVQRI